MIKKTHWKTREYLNLYKLWKEIFHSSKKIPTLRKVIKNMQENAKCTKMYKNFL